MMSHKVKWLIVIRLLLTEQVLCRAPPPPTPRGPQLPGPDVHEELEETAQRPRQSVAPAQVRLSLGSSGEMPGSASEGRIQSAARMITVLKTRLQGQIQAHLHMQGNISCQELLSASTMDDPMSFTLPLELLGLSLVPVLVAADCPKEAEVLMLRLYDLLGAADAEELLMEVERLMERRTSTSPPAPTPQAAAGAGRRMEAVMFNIQQLVTVGEGTSEQGGLCEGWTRVSGAVLVGATVEGSAGGLEAALSGCERLGALCAGVSGSGSGSGTYRALVKRGSRVLPSDGPGSECWIRRCGADADARARGRRPRRSPRRRCVNESERRVYSVVEWIPAVSTLYNLGTAVYYASVNCSQTAKERAIVTAVDLGTDALMVATGGAAGVAGYAVGAGVKTTVKASVKYLLDSMRDDDDVLVNQFSLGDDSIIIQ
ncbi:uncharacterized protein apof [Betta splendens]|uniref:Uncharacterized protein apof n=1 Tax=Betta splendens TaxID=158456 RepID=A0A6P7MLK2_BETSP|nr:uncharacterized protein apof [Betta splendens]